MKRIVAILLAVFMLIPVQAFALEEPAADLANQDAVTTSESIEPEGENAEVTEQAEPDAEEAEEQASENDENADPEEPDALTEIPEENVDEAEEEPEEEAEEEEEIDYSTWTTADFTYTEYSQRLYGCDYSRDFTVSGMAIEGFSEKGLEKLERNTDLVLPSTTDSGEELVGVAKNAFANKGLTSVRFPSGMYVDYDDQLTGLITKRGNFVIAESAFSNNQLTSVKLPDGVVAVMSNAFYGNQLKTVTLPKTIWWVETQSFAKNHISKVNFPERTWFMFEMHGMAFANNNIKSVRLPNTTAVVNKHTFMLNPGMEPLPEEAAADMAAAAYENSGVVYMYTDNPGLWNLDRIHHIEKTTASTKSWFQRLIINDGSSGEQDEEAWNRSDFTFSGSAVTGLSESGIAKRAVNKDLVLPDYTDEGETVTEIADAPASAGGLFATAEEKFDSVTLPSGLLRVGDNAFREAGLTEADLPPQLVEIGQSAFMMNNLETVVLPDTVTTMGSGAFATNKTLRKVVISKGMTEIPAAAFACSDAKNWMADFKKVVIPEGITKIGARAFAGSNIININIPEGVTEIGEYAFSTKNYLMLDDVECTLSLPDSLTTIGNRAFRNKLISEVELPESVVALPELTFEKKLSTYGSPDIPGSEPQGMVTKVYVSSRAQYEDKANFPASEYHKLILTDWRTWTAEDFTYGEWTIPAKTLFLGNTTDDSLTPTLWVVTGLSGSGKQKFIENQHITIPAEDPEGRKVQGVGEYAFRGTNLESELGCKIKSVTFPENVKTQNDKPTWDPDLEQRGDFFIANSAFIRNELTSVELPEGVIFVGSSAFAYNQITSVKIPSTMALIKSQAFASNQISTLDLPETVDYSFNVENMAFAINKIVSIQLPDNCGAIGSPIPAASLATVFFQNTGVEPVTGGNANMQKGGIVYMYKKTADGCDLIYNTENGGSYVEKLVIGTIPSDEAPWNTSDFTYSEDGSVITGLSDAGKRKIKLNPAMVLPDRSPAGVKITAIGDGVMGTAEQEQIGTFGIREDDAAYVPVSVKLPAELERIGNSAFSAYINSSTGETKGLTHVEFPDTLTSIGNTAFQNAPLTSVILPDSVTELGSGAFTGTIYVSEIRLSGSLTAIPDGAFTKTNNKIPFMEMATVERLEIPESVKTIGRTAFQGSKISELILHEGLESIGNNAFNNCQLHELLIPGSVTSIGSGAFAVINEDLQNSLTVLDLGDGFNGTIASNAFRGHALSKVEIDAEYSFDKINASAFHDTENKVTLLTSNEAEAARYSGLPNTSVYSFEVVFSKLAGTGWAEEDFIYSEDGSALLGYSESGRETYETVKTLVLPDYAPDGTEITRIGEEAFAVPEDEVDIGKYEANSDGVTSVDLPEHLARIDARAFEYNMLTGVDLESLEDLREIGESAFHGNHLKSVHIPDSVDTMGSGAFAMNAITDLRLSRNVPVIPQGAFAMNIRMSTLEIPDTVTEVGETAFAGARLTSLEIPDSVVKIGKNAFHLHHLDTLTIPGNVKEIGESAFEGTYKDQTLTELILEEGVESIGRRAFKEGLLTSVALPESLNSLAVDAFENNTGTGENHIVILTTTNPDHLQFNEGAISHLVVYGENIITLNAQGGVCDPGYLELDQNGRITAESFPVPAYDDCHEFLGWYTERSGGIKVSKYTRFAKGQIIYAHWNETHEWDEGTLTTIPTKDSYGVMTYTCTKDPEHTKTEAVGYAWEDTDFTYEGGVVTGLSDSGVMRMSFNKDMVIPDNSLDGTAITEIGEAAFRETAVETVVYPAGLKKIGKLAFHTTGLKEALIPDTVTSVGEGAYAMNWDLAKISIPDGLTEIPAGLFNRQLIRGEDKYDDYPSVGEVVIPDSVKTIGMTAFFGLSITKLTLPAELSEMGQSAFSNNKIAEVEIPGTLRVIPRQAFARGMAMFREPVTLSGLTLNEGTEEIGRNAFENSSLVSVQLPASMKLIDDTAFRVGMGATPDDEKILLRGTVEQHADTTLNTGTGLGHKFAPLIHFDPADGSLEDQYEEVNDEYKLDEMPVPVIDDCLVFDAWCLDEAGSEPVDEETVFRQDTTLHVRWKEGHDYVRTVIRKPTADTEGLVEYVCSRNPDHSYTETLPCLTEEEIAARDAALEAISDNIISANTVLCSGEYTSDSYQALSAAIDAANALYDDPSTTEADVIAAEAAISRALRSLKPIDKAAQAEEAARNTALNTLARNIIDAKSRVSKSAYKAASYAAFKKALNAAIAVMDDSSSDSVRLNKANTDLLRAWRKLKKKDKQTMKVSAKKVTLKAGSVRKKTRTIIRKKAFRVSNAAGKVTYRKIKGNGKVTVSSRGKITVRKGLKRGTYRIRVRVRAAGDDNHKAGSKIVTVRIRIK